MKKKEEKYRICPDWPERTGYTRTRTPACHMVLHIRNLDLCTVVRKENDFTIPNYPCQTIDKRDNFVFGFAAFCRAHCLRVQVRTYEDRSSTFVFGVRFRAIDHAWYATGIPTVCAGKKPIYSAMPRLPHWSNVSDDQIQLLYAKPVARRKRAVYVCPLLRVMKSLHVCNIYIYIANVQAASYI